MLNMVQIWCLLNLKLPNSVLINKQESWSMVETWMQHRIISGLGSSDVMVVDDDDTLVSLFDFQSLICCRQSTFPESSGRKSIDHQPPGRQYFCFHYSFCRQRRKLTTRWLIINISRIRRLRSSCPESSGRKLIDHQPPGRQSFCCHYSLCPRRWLATVRIVATKRMTTRGLMVERFAIKRFRTWRLATSDKRLKVKESLLHSSLCSMQLSERICRQNF